MNKKSEEFGSRNLYLTTGKRIVIDDHNCEAFTDGDKIIATKEELSNGIKVYEFVERILRLLGGN